MPLPFDILSTDFDGTIFAEFENPPLPRELETLIGELQGQGVRWIINTGRDMASLMESLGRAQLSIRPDYLVLVEREIHRHDGHHYVPVNPWNELCTSRHAMLFQQTQDHLEAFVAWVDANFDATLYADAWSPVCLITRTNAESDRIQEHARELCRKVPGLDFVRNDVYSRFCHEDFNKGTALAEVCRLLDVPPDRVAAAGDHLNDLPMLQSRFARWLISPANAVPRTREQVASQGGFISTETCGFGLLDGLRRILDGAS